MFVCHHTFVIAELYSYKSLACHSFVGNNFENYHKTHSFLSTLKLFKLYDYHFQLFDNHVFRPINRFIFEITNYHLKRTINHCIKIILSVT